MKIFPLFLLALFLLPFSSLNAQCSCDCDIPRDSLALVALSEATDGSSWTIPWNFNEPLTEWAGVFLNEAGCVRRISLSQRGLDGELPEAIGDLLCLEQLSLPWNNLTGQFPLAITNLVCLTDLTLSSNELDGAIPPEIGNLTQLERLGLNINNFTGNIPAEIGNLENLTSLALQSNRLQGCIPEVLLQFCDINLFRLNQNGQLPFRGDVDRFCEGEEQIGANCYANGQEGIIDENCDCVTATNTLELSGPKQIRIYPNPVRDLLYLESTQLITRTQLLDVAGRIIQQDDWASRSCKLNLTHLPTGIYGIRIQLSDRWEVVRIFKT